MIRVGCDKDKNVIFDFYGKAINLDYESREYYFAKCFNSKNLLVNEVNGHVVSSLQTNYYPLMLNGKKIMASYIFGQFYDKSKTIRVLNTLFEQASDNETYKTLITLVPISDPKDNRDYGKYGYEPVYYKRVYNISRDDLKNVSYNGVSKEFKIDDLIKVYNQFVQNFDGYLERNRSYWLDLLDLLQFKHYNLAVYYNLEGEAEGYVIYYIEASRIVVKEIVYFNGLALTRLLCYCLRLKKNLRVYTSADEDFLKAFPNIKYKTTVSLLAKVNDFQLFNRLYGTNVSSTIQAFKISGKSLFLNEEVY